MVHCMHIAPASNEGLCTYETRGMMCRAIYVVGGRNDTTYLDHVEKYDLKFCTWSTVAPLPKPLRCTTAVSYCGCLYVFGGETTSEIVNTAYKLVLTAIKWSCCVTLIWCSYFVNVTFPLLFAFMYPVYLLISEQNEHYCWLQCFSSVGWMLGSIHLASKNRCRLERFHCRIPSDNSGITRKWLSKCLWVELTSLPWDQMLPVKNGSIYSEFNLIMYRTTVVNLFWSVLWCT